MVFFSWTSKATILASALFLSVFLGCSQPPLADAADEELRVLFIGNSLSYTHDVPSLVAALAESVGLSLSAFACVCFPNYSLEEHWSDTRTRTALENNAWDVVIMQQGPSSLPESQEHLRTWATRFAEEIRSHDAEPAFYMVWPSIPRRAFFDDVIHSYDQAASTTGSLLFPVGEVWKQVDASTSDFSLYGPDGFHPSQEGAYTAAVVIYSALFDRSPVGLPARLTRPDGTTFDISPAHARTIQEVAQQVLSP